MRTGTTLLELLVVLTILGLLSAVVTMSIRLPTPNQESSPDSVRRMAQRAVHLGMPQRAFDSAGRAVLLLPDGRVVRRAAAPLAGGAP